MSASNGTCPLCLGGNGWTDLVAQQSVICPLCLPVEAEHQGLLKNPVRGWVPDWPQLEAQFMGPRMQVAPWLLVIHSGESKPGVAEFMHDGDMHDDNHVLKPRSAHICWSAKHNGFTQCVPLNRVAWHCGGSRYADYKKQDANPKIMEPTHRRLNFCSLSIELPGPWNMDRGVEQHDKLRAVISALKRYVPSLTKMVGHSEIDPKKRDPGPLLVWSKLEGLGIDRG